MKTSIVEAAAAVAAACKSCTITLVDQQDRVTGQPVKGRDGKQIFGLELSGPDVEAMVDRYQCKPGAERFDQPDIRRYTALFTEIHRRISRLHAGELCSRVISCAEVVK